MRLRASPLCVLLLAIGASFFQACVVKSADDKVCTLMGCTNGLTIALQASQWQTGTYQVELITDGRVVHCSATIPLPKGDPGQTCDASDVRLGLSGSELPVSSQSLSEIMFLETQPKVVQVTIGRDSTQLATQTFTPSYRTAQPNGPGCEPTCRYAQVTMSW